MASPSSWDLRRAGRRLAGLAVGGALLLLDSSPASAATQVQSGSVPLASPASTQTVVLDQFDPAAGNLDQVTVTISVDANTAVEVTNLTPAAKDATVALDATAAATGPGLAGLTAVVAESQTQPIDAAGSVTFDL